MHSLQEAHAGQINPANKPFSADEILMLMQTLTIWGASLNKRHLHVSFILPVEACYVRGLAIHDHIDLSSQLPFKAAFLSSAVMQLSGVLQLLMERIVLEVSVLNEVLPHLDFSLSLFNQGHELSCNSFCLLNRLLLTL